MALVFSTSQIQSISKDALLLPAIINAPDTGLIDQRAKSVITKDNLLITDNNNKVYSDFYEDTQLRYHNELVLLNNVQKTNYPDADLVSGGNGVGGHFPTAPAWVNMPPKLIDSLNGLPTNTLGNNLEAFHTNRFDNEITLLKTGFNDSAYNLVGTIAGTVFTGANVTGLVINQRILLVDGTNNFIGLITAIDIILFTFDFTIIYGAGFTGAATAIGSFSGFNNSQRGGFSTLVPNTNIYNAMTANIVTYESSWKAYVLNLKTIIDLNTDLSPRKSSNQTASGDCNTALIALSAWEALSNTGVSGKYVDASIAPLLTMITTRVTFTTNRIIGIATNVGSVAQNPDGSYTTSGAYGELFKNIDLRVNRASGSLSAYVNSFLAVTFFDQKIASANAQLAQYLNTFAISKISSDTTIGQGIFIVDTVSGLINGDTVYVMDNESLVYTRSISSIIGFSITLNTTIPAILLTSKLCRIVKQK